MMFFWKRHRKKKVKKRERADVEIMSPAKKRAKTPGIARIKKPARSVNNRKTLKVKRNAVHINHSIIEEN